MDDECPQCGLATEYIEEHDGVYCWNCEEYLDEMEDEHDEYEEYDEGPASQPVQRQASALQSRMLPVAIGYQNRGGIKVNKKTGLTNIENDFRNGRYDMLGTETCKMHFDGNVFHAVAFDKVKSSGIGIVPGVAIPLSKSHTKGDTFLTVPWNQVIDYRICGQAKKSRLVLLTRGLVIVLKPISDVTVEQAGRNKKMINSCQLMYEGHGINHPKGPGLYNSYNEPFAHYFNNFLYQLEQNGIVRRKSGFVPPVCQKHRKTGQFDPNSGRFWCEKCKTFVG